MQRATTHTGSLGSTIHVIRADPDTVAELAAIVCEAVDGVRFGETDDEHREAVACVVRCRQRMSLRVREEREPYPA